MNLRKLLFAILGLMMLTVSRPEAQEATLRIAAVVNDDVISAYDLNSRVRMVVTSSKMGVTPEVLSRLTPQILHTLIDEKLKLQLAKQLDVDVTEVDVQNTFANVERQNNIPPGMLDEFLRREGIDKAELTKQIRVEVAWLKTVQRKLGTQATVSEEDITRTLREMEENTGKSESRVSEIFLSVDNPGRDEQVRQLAERLIQQLREGASFPPLARSVSQSSTANLGGDLGWVQPGQLAPEVEEILAKMQPGQLSVPIRSAGGYNIVFLHERRLNPGIGGKDETLNLAQLFFPLPPQATASQIDSEMRQASGVAARVSSCDDMERLAKDIGSRQSGRIGDVRMANLPPPVRAIVANLKEGEISAPQRFDQGITVIMVCNRKAVQGDISERTRVQQLLSSQRVENASRQYLRDLRRTAFVDIRL
jgi:peptidyl-prolyl cis-trans isomerase SurA